VTDIEPIYLMRYENGADPIEVAVDAVAIELEVRNAVILGEIKYGHACTLVDQSDDAYARRIVAKLLNAGWTPPQVGGQ
jgi:hypothetical protein